MNTDIVSFLGFFLLNILYFSGILLWLIIVPIFLLKKMKRKCKKIEVFTYYSAPILFSIILSRSDIGTSIEKAWFFILVMLLFFSFIGIEIGIKKIVKKYHS